MSDEEEVDGGGLSVDGQTKLRLSFSDHQPSTINLVTVTRQPLDRRPVAFAGPSPAVAVP